MNEPSEEQFELQVQFIRKCAEESASIVGDAVEVFKGTWVVHGVLPYGGDVPMAVFDSYDQAKYAIDEALGA